MDEKRIQPPFTPRAKRATDTQNFDKTFTTEVPSLETLNVGRAKGKEPSQEPKEIDDDVFEDFSFAREEDNIWGETEAF